jgi:hypothetical protein
MDALSVHKVLLKILENLATDRATLHAALLANRMWAAAASKILWLYATPAMLSALPPNLRQSCANIVRHLIVKGVVSAEVATAAASVEFTRLVSLHLEPDPSGIAPTIRCCSVVWLLVAHGTQRSIAGLLQANASSLRSVKLRDAVTADDFLALARLNHLAQLSLYAPLSLQAAQAVAREAARCGFALFASLSTFLMRGSSAALALLLPHLRSVTAINLANIDLRAIPLAVVATRMRLVVLVLVCGSAGPRDLSQLLALRTLPTLRYLALGTPLPADHSLTTAAATGAGMSNRDFTRLLTGLPALEDLFFGLPAAALSVWALIAFARRCPHLKRVRIATALPLDELDHGGSRSGVPPLFPELTLLRLRRGVRAASADKPLEATVASIVRTLRYHAPKLRNLTFLDNDAVVREVMRRMANALKD